MFKHERHIKTDLRVYKVIIVVDTNVNPLDESHHKVTIIVRNKENQLLDTFRRTIDINSYMTHRSDILTSTALKCLQEYEDWDTEEINE